MRRYALSFVCLLPLCAAASSPQPVPLHHLYWHFLTIQNHLDREAADLQKKGEDAAPVRDFYKHKLGFDNGQFGKIRQAAHYLEPKLKQIDAQAKTIVDGVHAQYPPQLGKPARGAPGASDGSQSARRPPPRGRRTGDGPSRAETSGRRAGHPI